MSDHDSHQPDSQSPADTQQAYSLEVQGIPPHSHTSDVDINSAIARAVGERRRVRQLLLFLMLAGLLISVIYYGPIQDARIRAAQRDLNDQQRALNSQQAQLSAEQLRFEAATALTCVSINKVISNYDEYLTGVHKTNEARTDLTPEVKAQLNATYRKALLTPLDCVALKKAAK